MTYTERIAHLTESLDRYATLGIPCGGFLNSCLENDLNMAVCRADERNRPLLFDICLYIHNDMPSDCHGSPEKVAAWIRSVAGCMEVES